MERHNESQIQQSIVPGFQVMPLLSNWIIRVISRFVAGDQKASFYDDLTEEFDGRLRMYGHRRAMGWLWRHLIRTLPAVIGFQLYWRIVMLTNYMRIAMRVLNKHRAFSFINLFGLSLGLAVFLLIFMYVGYEWSFDRFHENHKHIYRLTTHMPGHYHSGKDKMAWASWGAAPAITETFLEVESYVRVKGIYKGKITVEGQSFFENGILYADSNFFDFFAFDLTTGSASDVLTDPNAVVISEKVRQKYFGSKNPVGEVLRLNEETDLIVRGVMANMPLNTQFTSDFIISLQTYASKYNQNLQVWSGGAYSFIRLAEDVDVSDFEKKMRSFTEVHMKEHAGVKPYLFLRPLGQIHLRTDLDGEMAIPTDMNTLTIFGTVAMLILLVACINYTNLTTARSTLRMKEVGIRKVVGACRGLLRYQFLGETFFLTGIAFVLAVVIVGSVLPAFNRFVERSIALTSLFSYPIALWAVLAFLGVGFLSGVYPAFYLSRFEPKEVLQSLFVRGSTRFNLRAILVVLQFAVSIILLVCTLVVKEQIHYIRDFKVGYTKDQIVVFEINDSRIRDRLDIIKNDLLQVPHVLKVSSSMSLPNSMHSQTRFRWAGMPEDLEAPVYVGFADDTFVDLYGLEIVEGRKFSREFPADKKGAILINETALKRLMDLGCERPMGRELIAFGDWEGRIVGVLKDFHFHSLHRPVEPFYLFYEPKVWNYWLSIKIDGQAISETLSRIQSYLNQHPTNYPFEYQFFDDVFDRLYRSEMRMEQLFSVFSGLAILIAGMGLLGLASFMVARRTKEIGIRKVLGSSEGRLVWNLLQSFLKWVVIANGIAWPMAWWFLRRWLMDFSYRTSLRPGIFILASLSTLVVAAAFISVQAMKAARANPVDALRYE